MKLFRILLGEALAELTLEEVRAYRNALGEAIRAVYAKETDVGDLKPSEVLAQVQEAVEAAKLADARITELEADDPEVFEARMAEMAEAVAPAQIAAEAEALSEAEPEEPAEDGGDDETSTEPEEGEEGDGSGDGEGEEATAAAEAETIEPETVVAAADEAPVVTRLPAPSRSRAAAPPVSAPEWRATLTASAEGLGLPMGAEFDDELALAAAMITKRQRFGHMTAREDVPIGLIDWRDAYPEERKLSGTDSVEANTSKIQSMLAAIQADPNKGTPENLVAAGGICAPLTPFYDLLVISRADRPVRAALPSFLAERGGIRYATPPTLADVSDAVGIITAAEDAAGGTSATKTCQVLECPPFNDATVNILYHCVQTSNLTNRTFPEQLAQFNQLVMAAFARMAETQLLDGMKSHSTHVTAATSGLGMVGDLLPQVLAAAAGMRSRHRMNPEAVLRMIMPRWAVSQLVSDVVRSQFERFDTDEARITALLRSYNVEPTFYIDTATGDGNIFGAQSAGALLPFPANVDWFLFPEGTFLFLDGGTLELGLVRDSILNSTNEFQVFGESFENVAFLGIESLYITSTVCDSGVVAAPGEVDCGNWT